MSEFDAKAVPILKQKTEQVIKEKLDSALWPVYISKLMSLQNTGFDVVSKYLTVARGAFMKEVDRLHEAAVTTLNAIKPDNYCEGEPQEGEKGQNHAAMMS